MTVTKVDVCHLADGLTSNSLQALCFGRLGTTLDNGHVFSYVGIRFARAGAQVAQVVEQGTENPCVGGSTPSLGTILPEF